MSLDDAIANRESETGALRAFCCKEWVEDPLPYVFRHSRSRISKAQAQPRAFTHAPNRKVATLRHCVYSIDDQIDKNLSQLGSTGKSMLPAFSLQSNLIFEASQ